MSSKLQTTMSRVFSTLFRKTPREIVSRRMSPDTSEASKWEERKLQMQLQHELTMKRLELDQKELELAQKKRAGVIWSQSGNRKSVDSWRYMCGDRVQWSLACVTNIDGHKSELGLSSARGV